MSDEPDIDRAELDDDRKVAGEPKRRLHFWRRLLGVLLLAALLWSLWVYRQIEAVAHRDDAQPADAIAVFGAAEYAGRPSPVLHARLDKAVQLYDLQIAPEIVTLGGGASADSGKTEGGVGRDYLLAKGVPLDHIIAETDSFDTEQQVERLAQIAAERGYRRVVVVSDGTHLFRIAVLCQRAGLDVYTSPRATLGNIDRYDAAMRILHEIASYTALRMKIPVDVARRWLGGHDDP